MPDPRKRSGLYGSINAIVLEIVLIVIMLVLILGVVAFPYYVSPITSSGASGGILYLIFNFFIAFLLLIAAYFYEEKNPEYGSFPLILAVIVLVLVILSLYGLGNIKTLLNV